MNNDSYTLLTSIVEKGKGAKSGLASKVYFDKNDWGTNMLSESVDGNVSTNYGSKMIPIHVFLSEYNDHDEVHMN